MRWSTRTQAENDVTRTNQVRLSTRFSLVPNRLSFFAEVNYDINESLAQLQRYLMNFNGSCYTLSLEAANYQHGVREDTEYRFLVTLKNVGTFLDINGGTSASL